MTPRELLYKAIKELVYDSRFEFKYSDMDQLSEMTCGIYIRSGKSPMHREFDGEYLTRNASVLFRINSSYGLDGIRQGDEFCEQIFKKMQTCFNYIFTDDDGNSITIIKTDAMGDVNDLGKNETGTKMYSLNFNIMYGG